MSGYLLGKVKEDTTSLPNKDLLSEAEKLEIAKSEFKEVLKQNFSNFEQNLYRWCIHNHQEKKFISLIDKYNNITINTIEEIDYQEYIKKYILDNFYFSLIDFDEYIDIQAIFTKNKKLIDYDKISNKTEYRSLLHFDNKIDEIKEYILFLQEKPNITPKSTASDIPNIMEVDLNNITPKRKTPKKSPWKPHVSNPNNSPKKIGIISEEKVFKSLVKKFGIRNVHWNADRISDGYGYDIWYINKNKEIKYVEVKTYSNQGRFYISPNEVKFAKDNKDAYELYLVADEVIYKVKNFHKLKKIIENYTVRFSLMLR